MLIPILLLTSTAENYHPNFCNVNKYIFAFVKIGNEYKIHGLWPDECKECETCGYPTCCNMKKFGNTTQPKDKKFLEEHWLETKIHHKIQTCGKEVDELIEHEIIKHASCMNMHVDEYIMKVKELFYKYHDYVVNNCNRICSLVLDENFLLLQ
jgi:ribonuclease I